MASLKDLLVKGPSNLIGDVTVNKIRLTSLEVNNGTNYDPGSNGQVLKSNGTSVYWANDNNTITANATDGLWDLTGTDGTNSVTYALAPYSSKQTTASFYTGTTAPSLNTRLNYDGYLYAKKLYSDGAETITKNGGIINNSLTLQKSSTSPDSPELIFNGQAGNSNAYKWSIQKNSSGDLIFSKISSNNTSTTTIVFSADGYLLPNITNTYNLGSNNNKWANVYATNFKGNADTATTLSSTLSINKGGTNNTSFINNSLIYYKDNQLKSIPDVLYQNNGILKIGNDDSIGSDMVEVYGNMFIDGLIIPPLYTERNYDEDVKYDLGYSGGYEWDNVYANNFIGNLTGNADTATSDSDNNVIKDTYVKKSGGKMTGNLTSNATASLGTTSEPWHNIVLGGATNDVMTASSTNPRITFYERTSGTQPVHLIYTDLDSYRSPAGLKVIGGTNATPAWFEVEGNIYVGSGNSTAGNCSILTEKALTFSYGGGWFMQDTAWIRATNGKGVYIPGNSTFRADGSTQFKTLTHVDSNIVDNGKWITGATGTANSGDNNATQGTLGLSILYIGNNIARPAAGTAGGANNSKGYLYIYGPDTTAGELSYNGSMFESDKSIYLRNNSDNGIANEVRGKCGTSDYWRIAGGATASNAGYVEIATADDGNEPIYIRQYNGTFSTIKRAATLLDANGNTNFPGNLVAKMGTFTGSATSDNNINEYYLYGGITIRESNNVGSTQSDFAYAPRLTFLWNNRTTATISLDSSGTLRFRRLDGETLTSLSANLNGNATTATRANITSALNSLAYYNSNNGAFASSTSSFIINENSTKGILTTVSSGSAGYTLENTNISNSIKGGFVVDNNSNIGIYKNTPSLGRWILKYNAINNKTYIPDWTCGSIISPVYFDSNGSPVAIDPYIYTSQEGGGVVIPFIYNDLAYLHEKGGSYKWYITTSTNFTSTSLDSASGTTMIANNTDDLDILFNGSGDSKDMGQKYNDRMVIDIVCPKTFTWNTLFYIDFHTQDFCATQVGIYVAKDSGTYVDLTNLTFSNSLTNPLPTINNGTLKNGTLSVEKKNSYYMRMITHNDISTGFNKIRIVLTNWIYKNADNNSGDHYHRISGIGLINYSSLGVRETFMSRGMDDPLYRSLTQKHYINDNSRALVINPRNKITYSSGNDERFLLITLPTLSNVTISFEIDIFNNNEHATYYIRGKIPTNTDAGTAWTNCYASSIGSKKIGNCSVYFTRKKHGYTDHTGRYQVAIGYHKIISGTNPYWIWDSNTEIIIKNVFIHKNSNNDISFLNNFDIISFSCRWY